jgi:type VI protein secretion system component VasF
MNHDKLETRIKENLEASIQHIDDDTKHRLQKIRRQAMNQPVKTSWFKSHQWVPAASLAFFSVIAIMLYLPSQQSQTNVTTTQIDQTAMLELIDSPDDIDTLSDPDFYMWLDETAGT